jgi:two-component system sensor histidine kinase/response regulator
LNDAVEVLGQRLSAIQGLDVQLGLQHLRGRWDSYVRLLRTFAETRDTDAAAMRGCLAERDYPELSSLMHNVKGVSGFLGATGIRNLATEICTAVRAGADGEDIERLANEMLKAQTELSKSILALVGQSPEAGDA